MILTRELKTNAMDDLPCPDDEIDEMAIRYLLAGLAFGFASTTSLGLGLAGTFYWFFGDGSLSLSVAALALAGMGICWTMLIRILRRFMSIRSKHIGQ